MRKSDGTLHLLRARRRLPRRPSGSAAYERAINEQGTDHHGTIARVRAGLQALDIGIPQGYPDYVLHKMVTVMRGGEEVKISKRAGSYVTLRDLIEWSRARRGALLPASRASPTPSSCSTSTWRARRATRTRCTTCSTRTRASAACCASCRNAGCAFDADNGLAQPLDLDDDRTRKRC